MTDLLLVLPAAPENVVVARQAITGLCEGLGFPSRATDDVRLAVTEACTNVVVHAYAPETTSPQLELEAQADGDELNVTVRDQGRGMGVFTGAAGLGLGLPLIAALTRAVEMRAGPGGVGTEIAMTFSKDDADRDGDSDGRT